MAACPELLAKADMGAFGRHSGYDPLRTPGPRVCSATAILL